MTYKATEDRFLKDPVAVKDYTIDWTDWLEDDTIQSSSWEVPTGITKDSDTTLDDLKAIIWLSGGTAETDYKVFNTITTVGGRTERAMLLIQVR